MNKVFILLTLLLFNINTYSQAIHKIDNAETIFDKYQVEGSILIYNQNTNQYLAHNIDRCNTPYSPASTFKIPNTLIALETGIITTDTIFRWQGEPRMLKTWEADMNIAQAYKVSCVPVYQDIARRIGLEQMQYYVRLFHFGEMDINTHNLDKFWLEGDSKITQFEQIYFLKRLQNQELPVSKTALSTLKEIMLLEQTDKYSIYAKTGWGQHLGKDIGWFVGYVETRGNIYYFATNIEPAEKTIMSNFAQIRIDLTKEILTSLGIIRQ